MKFIKDTTWAEVFESWRKREANNPGWIKVATEIKGWPDWESWRRSTAELMRADERDWKIYEFTDPINEIPEMLLGPYSGWQSRVPKKNVYTFDDLLSIPEQYEHFSKHEGVRSIMNGLPFETEFIGLIRDDLDKIICIEGHHRAAAITIAKKQGRDIDLTGKVRIALAHLPKEEAALLYQVLEKGTSNK